MLFMKGISSLQGGGGTERFFADFYDKYQNVFGRKFKLYFLLDKQSIVFLNEVNKLKNKTAVLIFKQMSNRLKLFLESIQINFYILFYRIDIIHIPLYDMSYIPLLKKNKQLTPLFSTETCDKYRKLLFGTIASGSSVTASPRF